MKELRLNIDGLEKTGFKGQMILDIALASDIKIPHLCHDNRMDVYGACGICVVEVEGFPKLLRACSTEISDGMVIWTDTPRVRDSRKVNLELLLSQHTGDCRPPCGQACPAQTDCQGYVGLIANGEMEEALKLIKEKVPLAASIGRVCTHPCQDECRRRLVEEPVSIMDLKRFAAEIDLSKPEPYLPEIAPPTGKTVGIIGGGPGGLSCAYFLAQMGHDVTIFEAMPKMGGMLRYGIPEYRLPKGIVNKEAGLIEKMGVTFRNGIRVGHDVTFESLRKRHDAVVIAVGAWKSLPLPCTGAHLPEVMGGVEFLRKVYSNELVSLGRNIAVVGGGNTAMDVCRTAIRMGAENVYIVYRRTRAEMPAAEVEIVEAEEEGVIFKFLVNPLEIMEENGKASRMRLQKMRLGEPDESGRRRPLPIEGEVEMLEVDMIVTALGQGIIPDGFEGIDLTRWNTIIADEKVFTTNEKGVFAIGDCTNEGAATAIESIAEAKKAAAAIDGYLSGVEIGFREHYRVVRDDLTEADFENRKKEPRSQARYLEPAERADNFFEIMETLERKDAIREASRCLECGCLDYFECKLIALADEYHVKPDRFRESVPKSDYCGEHPRILRDPNKCILCGLCVRMCDELIGSTALGFVDRGFNSVVMPAFKDPLSDTSCVSCGQCISVCPTGALQEKIAFHKPVPLETKKTDTICGMCAIICSMRIVSRGNMLIKATPTRGYGVNDGVMCGRGRFGMIYVQRDGRITTPLVRKKGVLTPSSWHDAFVYTAKKMESIRIRGRKTAVSIGQSYCIEDTGAVLNLASKMGAEVFSFANRENGLARVLGYDGSPNTLAEVSNSDYVFVFGSLVLTKNPVIVSKLRQAVKNGASVTVVSIDGSECNVPCRTIVAPDSTAFMKQVLKSLIDSGCRPKNADGFEELQASLSAVTVSEDAKALADSYRSAKKAMILYALFELSAECATEIANMSVIAGHIGGPRNGIYTQRQMAGSQILADYGITATAETTTGYRGLAIFGEDPELEFDENELEFLMVQDTHMTATAQKADVVFPLASYPEINGTFVSSGRRLLRCNKAVEPPFEYRTADIAQKIAEFLAGSAPAGSARSLYPDTEIGECYPAPVLYTDGFGFPDKKAKLQVAPEAAMFDERVPTFSLFKAVRADLPDPK